MSRTSYLKSLAKNKKSFLCKREYQIQAHSIVSAIDEAIDLAQTNYLVRVVERGHPILVQELSKDWYHVALWVSDHSYRSPR
jgi:hypothetical protein